MDHRVVVGLVGVALVGFAGTGHAQSGLGRDPSSQPPVGLSPLSSITDSINNTSVVPQGVPMATLSVPPSPAGPGQDAPVPRQPVPRTPVSLGPMETINHSISRGFGFGTVGSLFRRPVEPAPAPLLRSAPRVERSSKLDTATVPSLWSDPPVGRRAGGRPAPFAKQVPDAPRAQALAPATSTGPSSGRPAPYAEARTRLARPQSTAGTATAYQPAQARAATPQPEVVVPTPNLPLDLDPIPTPQPEPKPEPKPAEPAPAPTLPEPVPTEPVVPLPAPAPVPTEPELPKLPAEPEPASPLPMPMPMPMPMPAQTPELPLPVPAPNEPVAPLPSPTPMPDMPAPASAPIEAELPKVPTEPEPSPPGPLPEPLPLPTPSSAPDELPALGSDPIKSVEPSPMPELMPMPEPIPATPSESPSPAPAPLPERVDPAVSRTRLDPTAIRTKPVQPRQLASAAMRAAAVGDQIITFEELKAAVDEEVMARSGGQASLMSKAERRNFDNMVAASILNRMIDQALILQEANRMMSKKPEIKQRFEEEIEKDWKIKELAPLLRKTATSNVHELKAKLAAEGKSYEMLKDQHRKLMFSREFMNSQIRHKVTSDLPEMKAYYNAHLKDFEMPARISWRDVEIDVARYPGRAAARKKADEALARLLHSEDFETVARSVSNGPTASKGGLYADMTPGSYGTPIVNNEINRLPVGQVSQILEAADSFHIVRVESRREKGPLWFDEVQDKVRNLVFEQNYHKAVEDYLAKLRANTLIRTMFDNTASDPEIARRAMK